MNEGLLKNSITYNLDIRVFDDADNFFKDDEHVDRYRDIDDTIVASTYRVVKQLWKENFFFVYIIFFNVMGIEKNACDNLIRIL